MNDKLFIRDEKIYAVQHPQSRKVSYDTIRALIKNINT